LFIELFKRLGRNKPVLEARLSNIGGEALEEDEILEEDLCFKPLGRGPAAESDIRETTLKLIP
jgi:hypothetical protein